MDMGGDRLSLIELPESEGLILTVFVGWADPQLNIFPIDDLSLALPFQMNLQINPIRSNSLVLPIGYCSPSSCSYGLHQVPNEPPSTFHHVWIY
jgi:hypothetical protein